MIDRTSKIILIVIAAGLWANMAAGIFHAGPAVAQTAQLNDIAHDLHSIYSGVCVNSKIC